MTWTVKSTRYIYKGIVLKYTKSEILYYGYINNIHNIFSADVKYVITKHDKNTILNDNKETSKYIIISVAKYKYALDSTDTSINYVVARKNIISIHGRVR